MIPLNYPATQAETQVTQFIEGTGPSPLSGKHSPLGTIATSSPGSSTVTFPHPGG